MNLDFLNNVEVEAIKISAPKTKSSVPTLPTEADLRVFGNGRVFPNEAFAASMELEFQPKVEDKVLGNGLEIFNSIDWGMIAGKLPEELIFCCTVPKTAAKVDMWGSTTYDKETGAPKASVLTQGANTFAKKQLIPMLTAIYNIDWENTVYVDLKVVPEHVIASPNGVYHLPKIVSGGAHKGEHTYVRRENLTIMPLVVAHTEVKEVKEAPASDVIADKAPDVTDTSNASAELFTETATEEATDNSQEVQEVANTTDPGDNWAAQLGQPTDQQ